MTHARSLARRPWLLGAALVACFLALSPVRAHGQSATVTMGDPGDHWLDTMMYYRVERATVDGVFGYAILYDAPAGGDLTMFWPRSDIDLAGKGGRSVQRSMDLPGGGRLYYPGTLSAKTMPREHHAIMMLEDWYTRAIRTSTGTASQLGTDSF